MGLGKSLKIIAFLSAIMRKTGTPADISRRAKHVDRLQDKEDWRRSLPPADSTWPTAMVVAPSSVIGNWEREFTKVGATIHSIPQVPVDTPFLLVGPF